MTSLTEFLHRLWWAIRRRKWLSYRQEVLTDEPWCYWTFEETQETPATHEG